MEKTKTLLLISYWQTILDVQSAYLNPNVTAKLEATLVALNDYLEILKKAG